MQKPVTTKTIILNDAQIDNLNESIAREKPSRQTHDMYRMNYVGGLEAALNAARRQFQFYADEHSKAGKTEKAHTNQVMANICKAALEDFP